MPRDADTAAISLAVRRLAKQWPPDRWAGGSTEAELAATIVACSASWVGRPPLSLGRAVSISNSNDTIGWLQP